MLNTSHNLYYFHNFFKFNFTTQKIISFLQKINYAKLYFIYKNNMILAKEVSKLENFLDNYNIIPSKIEKLQGDLSARIYYRIYCANKPYILVDSSSDSSALFKMLNTTRTFKRVGVKVPEVFRYDLDLGFALIEDFGPIVLNSVIDCSNSELYYKNILDILINLQTKTFNNNSIADLPNYNSALLDEELLKFCNYFLKYKLQQNIFDAAKNELFDIFHTLYTHLNSTGIVLVHRDYHLDNMLLEKDTNTIGIIDHQDAVFGSCAYDVASLLQDARREVSASFEQEMLNYFLDRTGYNRNSFLKEYYILALQKNFKIIGIFNKQSIQNRHFKHKDKLSLVWNYVSRTLEYSADILPQLSNWFKKYNIPLQNE